MGVWEKGIFDEKERYDSKIMNKPTKKKREENKEEDHLSVVHKQ